jgi:hypothetical protein
MSQHKRSPRKIAFSAAGAVLSFATCMAFPAAVQGNDDVRVCIGLDSVLRAPDEKTGLCLKGSQQLSLARPEIAKPETDDSDPLGPAKGPGETSTKVLADIERRLSDLEKPPLFEVVNETRRVIFSVAPGRVQLYNESAAVAGMLGSPQGGQFVSRSTDGAFCAYVGAYGERAGLRLSEGGQPHLDLLKQPGGSYSLKIRAGDGDIAGIGESKAGTGALVVGDKSGQHKAAVQVDNGKGVVSIFNDSGRGVASLTQSTNGGGLLVLADAASDARVMMGSNDNRYGVVMTFPSGLPYVPKSGLPGSYMLGCAAGPACVP